MRRDPPTAVRRLAEVPRDALVAFVRGYRFFVSPWRPASCRFEPTCSVYALEALGRHGAAAGSYLAAQRLLRCGPWCDGGVDAVPAQPPRPFRRRSSPSPVSTPPAPP